jgi:two-component sensor histidine kinase
LDQQGGDGSGRRIVTALAQQLHGELTVTSDNGTTWQLVFPPSAK